MNMSVHNLMAFHSQYFRPQPAVSAQKNADGDKEKSFHEILKEKMDRPTQKS
ncbi:hypothetical protein GCM10010969_32110 [Saccharibacillus kuerlensis]|uniref:YpzG-like protein n=1 Tax=Saccharibacillus kuerlensis TaxID=459527 RepID=A0ABQ2L9G3_9BACL|nr:hypothetical protein GCM10010969_32110 [Saccharibacillus kuerlensis]